METPQRGNSRYLALSLVGIILFYLWPVEYLYGQRPELARGVILLSLLLCLEYNRKQPADRSRWGFSRRDFFPALRWALFATAPAVAAILLAGLLLKSVSGRAHPFLDLTALLIWGLAQQFALQTVLLHELRKFLTSPRAVAAAAGVFSLLHLPNPFLAPVVFVAAIIWCSIYERHPHVLPLALSHALCSLAILENLPRSVTGGMRVGFSYLLR